MAIPIDFPFHRGRPCVHVVAVREGGESELLRCFLDFGTTEPGDRSYTFLLYQLAMSKVDVIFKGPIVPLSLIDGSIQDVQAIYIRVDWWTHSPILRGYVLAATRFGLDVDGHVGTDFFHLRKLTIDHNLQRSDVS